MIAASDLIGIALLAAILATLVSCIVHRRMP